MRLLEAVIQGTAAGILARAISHSLEAFEVLVDLSVVLECQMLLACVRRSTVWMKQSLICIIDSYVSVTVIVNLCNCVDTAL
jgi:hypothetical protein